MAMIRTFISVELAEDIKKEILNLQRRLKVYGGHIGWVRPDAIHLTLKFLGDIDEKEINNIETAAKEAIKGFDPFYLRLLDLGAFPDLKRPRIIWLGISEESDNLTRLQMRIEDEIERAGHPREGRRFKPHLTIGRVKGGHGLEKLIDAIDAERGIDLGGFDVTEVLIMKSELRPEGAVYTRLCEIGLG